MDGSEARATAEPLFFCVPSWLEFRWFDYFENELFVSLLITFKMMMPRLDDGVPKVAGDTPVSGGAGGAEGANGLDGEELKPPRRKRPKLTAELLAEPRGLDTLYAHFPKLPLRTWKGEASEASDAAVAADMRQLMLAYKDWAMRIYPHLAFEDFIERVAKMTGKTRDKIESMRRFEIDRVTGASAAAAAAAAKEVEEDRSVMAANAAAALSAAAVGEADGEEDFNGPDDDEVEAAMAAAAEASTSRAPGPTNGGEDSMSDLEGVDW